MDIFFITAAAVVIYGIAYLLETKTLKSKAICRISLISGDF